MKRIVKGQYGYIDNQRKLTIIRTISMFGIVLALFFIGIWSAGTKKNLLTIVAVLGCLPASKSMVNMIMFLRAKGCSVSVKEEVIGCCVKLTQLYDMFFTSYEKSYSVSHMVVKGKVICGYTEDDACDCSACEKHLLTLLKQGGCKGVTVKIYHELTAYCEGLKNMEAQEEEAPDEDIMLNLLSISL